MGGGGCASMFIMSLHTYENFTLEFLLRKQKLLLESHIFPVGLGGEGIRQLYLLPPDSSKPDIAKRSILTWKRCGFCFNSALGHNCIKILRHNLLDYNSSAQC